MINTNAIGSHVSKSAATELSPLVEKLAKKADTNRDGQVTSSEFQEFLAGLMKSIEENQRTAEKQSAAPGTSPVASGNQSTSPANAVRTIRAIAAAIAKEQ